MLEAMRKAVAPLEGRIRMAISRGLVSLVDDARKAQALQIELLDGEAQDGVERFQQYGFTSHPHPGAEAIAVCAGGLRSHAVVIAVEDRRYRLTNLQQGEAALYDDLGNAILLGRNSIKVTAVSKVEIEAPEVTIAADTVAIDADVTVTGTIEAQGDVTGAGTSLHSHVHIGVSAGAANSGAPA